MVSILEQLIDEYPSAQYDWLALSLNPSISFEFINSHRDLPWVLPAISRNTGITESIVRSNLEFPWSYNDLCNNPNISFEFFLQYAIKPTSRVDINWDALSKNPAIPIEIIDQYTNYHWNDRFISANPNITSNYILNTGKSRKWFMPYVSSNPGITERDIYKNVLDWSYLNLSSNINLPAKYVNDNLQYLWNLHSVSSNPNITVTDIESFHLIPWDYYGLSLNPNITTEYVISHDTKSWKKDLLLINAAITSDSIFDNYDYFNITNMETHMCSNPTITYNWIKRNIRFINWKKISKNKFI